MCLAASQWRQPQHVLRICLRIVVHLYRILDISVRTPGSLCFLALHLECGNTRNNGPIAYAGNECYIDPACMRQACTGSWNGVFTSLQHVTKDVTLSFHSPALNKFAPHKSRSRRCCPPRLAAAASGLNPAWQAGRCRSLNQPGPQRRLVAAARSGFPIEVQPAQSCTMKDDMELVRGAP